MNTDNSTASEPHNFKLNLTGKHNLNNPKKKMALAILSIYYTWANIKSEYNNDKFEILAPTSNDTFDLPGGSYPVSIIQGYFECINKKHEALTENPPIQIICEQD